jgi:tRNA-Thr(GGU) m(6)t(6)A37 methyltransferase TsaA
LSTAAPEVRVIGLLRSCFREKFGTPRQPLVVPGATASLTVAKEFHPEQSLSGLEHFSHVWLVSYFHLNTNKRFASKVHPPRLRGGSIGLFATRSPHRPSPLGLSLARLVAVEGDTLRLAGIDLVDGTPILDVKPYVPEWDGAALGGDATAGWTAENPFPKLRVVLAPAAAEGIRAAEARLALGSSGDDSGGSGGGGGLREQMTDILSQELRNPRDKKQMADGTELGFFLYDFEVRFVVRSGTATVVGILTDTVMNKRDRRLPPSPVPEDPAATLLIKT